MRRELGLLLLVSCVVLLQNCSSVNTRSVKHYARLDYQGRWYQIGGWPGIHDPYFPGEVLEYPITGEAGTYEVVKKHFASPEGNVCVYSTTFYRRTFLFYLVFLGGGRRDFLTIVKWVEEAGGSSHVLVYDFNTGPGSVLIERGTIKIEADGSLHTFEADAVGSFHAYTMSYKLTPEVVLKLREAREIRVSYMKDMDQWRVLSHHQRSILQSFLADTEHIACGAKPIDRLRWP